MNGLEVQLLIMVPIALFTVWRGMTRQLADELREGVQPCLFDR